MIEYINGDIFKIKADVVCHQVNCKGVMGSGIAREFAVKYPDMYWAYKKLCKESTEPLLGHVLWYKLSEDSDYKYIANIFGQNDYGRHSMQTDYEALKSGFTTIAQAIDKKANNFKSLAIPYGIGCGLGGGNWNIVEGIIHSVFTEFRTPHVLIVKKTRDND